MLKVLKADIVFKLPEDFEGSFAEALQLYVDFLRDSETGLDEPPHTVSFDTRHAAFEGNRRLGLASVAKGTMAHLTLKGWRQMDLKLPPRCHVGPVYDKEKLTIWVK